MPSNSSARCIFEYYPRIKKNGQPGKIIGCRVIYYTPLNTCELCGKTSTPKKVSTRNDVYGWDYDDDIQWHKQDSKSMLCIGCWNKVRPVYKRKVEVRNNMKIINKLYKVIRDERKNQNYRRIEGFFIKSDD